MGKGWFLLSLFVFAVAIVLNIPLAWAQTATEDTISDRVAESISSAKETRMTAAEELVYLLKQKALRKVEGERKKQFLKTKGTLGLHIAYDNNINTDSQRRGDFYLEQYFAYNWVPTFSDYFGAEIGTWYFSDFYFENGDTTLLDNAFNAMLLYYPWGNPNLELKPGIETAFAYYPFEEKSTYREDKAFLKWKHRFWNKWSHDGKYEYSFKEYDVKESRNAAAAYITAHVLEKIKQTVEYNFAFPAVWGNSLKIKQTAYKETSNDAYQDYYDLYSYKVTAEVGRSLTKKLYAKVSTAFERKNYWQRIVSDYQVAEYDDVYTHKLDMYYTLKKDWTLSYSLQFKKSDSNYAIYDYDSYYHKAGIYISF